jgi:hypothetical protein
MTTNVPNSDDVVFMLSFHFSEMKSRKNKERKTKQNAKQRSEKKCEEANRRSFDLSCGCLLVVVRQVCQRPTHISFFPFIFPFGWTIFSPVLVFRRFCCGSYR